ncbi:hypothetical protein RvY_03185 [Ramazzottius varieornatus]|uniref:Uncharacterized protein n=1 Tax=Ramazzottius varieornatus TaxID=947166 RepID=A0A1D1USY4_RAMVA|nr:hypothetical protein RvY_03185 [Ramazzottius varieornatus]
MLFFIHFVLPGMKARKKGVIVNLSSVAAVYPLPNYALYGATKAFVAFFSTALDRECRPYGIFVQTLFPGPVLTSRTRNQGKSVFLVQAIPYARAALSQIGLRRRTFGHWIHALMVSIAKPIPLWLQRRLLRPRSSTLRT